MNIAVIGTGYVGLVTGVCLAEIGHQVTCIDVDTEKIRLLSEGKSPIYEPGLEELLKENILRGRLRFTTRHCEGMASCNVVMVAVGTPQSSDGSADLSYVEQAAEDIAANLHQNMIVVIKSTVPIGTCEKIKARIESFASGGHQIEVASNPEFLREGSAVHDNFHGDRIVIGAEREEVAMFLEAMYEPFNIPVIRTDLRSAEMIKYASNAFLATKISFINEIANLCERLGADVSQVANGMGHDQRIGPKFLSAGIGFGGSCFPKDTHALVKIAASSGYEFPLLKTVIRVNEQQRSLLVTKARQRFGTLLGKKVTLLGLTFKPNTDDIREAPAQKVAELLLREGAEVTAYDPMGMENAKAVMPGEVDFADSLEEALTRSDCAFILTEWPEIVNFLIENGAKQMKNRIIFDGRNCFPLEFAVNNGFEYHSVGRTSVMQEKVLV